MSGTLVAVPGELPVCAWLVAAVILAPLCKFTLGQFHLTGYSRQFFLF